MSIFIPRKDFSESIAWLTRKRKRLPKASIEVLCGRALIDCGKLFEASVPCRGDLPLKLTFDGAFLLVMAMHPEDEIELNYEDGRIWLGNLSIAADAAYPAPRPRDLYISPDTEDRPAYGRNPPKPR